MEETPWNMINHLALSRVWTLSSQMCRFEIIWTWYVTQRWGNMMCSMSSYVSSCLFQKLGWSPQLTIKEYLQGWIHHTVVVKMTNKQGYFNLKGRHGAINKGGLTIQNGDKIPLYSAPNLIYVEIRCLPNSIILLWEANGCCYHAELQYSRGWSTT